MSGYTFTQAAEETGLTYRQLNYWADKGMFGTIREHPGSGYRRPQLNDGEMQALRYLAELLESLRKVGLEPTFEFIGWAYLRLSRGVQGFDPTVILLEAVKTGDTSA